MMKGRHLLPGDFLIKPPPPLLPPLLPLPPLPPEPPVPVPPLLPESLFVVSTYVVNENYGSRYIIVMVPGQTKLYRWWLAHEETYTIVRGNL